jgi:hypothetical protein
METACPEVTLNNFGISRTGIRGVEKENDKKKEQPIPWWAI